jgi:hypothetical protein
MRKRRDVVPAEPTSDRSDVTPEETVESLSAQLQDQLKPEADKLNEFLGAMPPKPIADDVRRIVEATFLVGDVFPVYERLEKALRIGEGRTEHGVVATALDEAETNARTAFKLWQTGKAARESWELTNGTVFSAMWNRANAQLQSEKDEKKRNKAITDADIRAMCFVMFPDEYEAQERERKRVEAMEKSLAHLSETWNLRVRTLQTMLQRSR